jgi:phospholipase/carboxylesterase
MREQQFGELTVRVTGGRDLEGAGDGPLIVLLHGFGAPGTDLVPLWRQLNVPHEVRFAFPEAPLDLARIAGPGYAGGRAWWMIDLAALEAAMATGRRPDRSHEEPEGLAEARDALVGTLSALQRDLGVPDGQLVLGGFSQGSMLALDVALRTQLSLAGLVLMSSTLIARDAWEPAMPNRAGLPVLMSHGRADPLLPFATAETLRGLLEDAGMAVQWHPFNGGHTITEGVLEDLSPFLGRVLPLPD